MVLLAAIAGGAFAAVALTGPLSAARVRDTVEKAHGWGAVAFILLSSLLTAASFPGPLLAAAAGLLFGVAEGTLIAVCSATLGASLSFGISRRFGAGPLLAVAGRRVLALEAWVGDREALSVLYARLIPGLPFTLVNYGFGLMPVRFLVFASITLVAIAPRTFAYVSLGGSFTDLSNPKALIAAGVLVGMAILGLIVAWRGRQRARSRPAAPGAGSSSPADRSAGPP